MKSCSTALEMAGAALLQRQPLSVFGTHLIAAGQEISSFGILIPTLSSDDNNNNNNASTIGKEVAQRCQYAATQMILAGTNVCPSKVTNHVPTSGKSWLKGGI